MGRSSYQSAIADNHEMKLADGIRLCLPELFCIALSPIDLLGSARYLTTGVFHMNKSILVSVMSSILFIALFQATTVSYHDCYFDDNSMKRLRDKAEEVLREITIGVS